MLFRYKARDNTGKTLEGRIEAQDRSGALAALQQQNLFVVSLVEGGGLRLNLNSEIRLGGRGRPKAGELALFCSQFATLLSAGVPVLQALAVLRRQMQGKRLGDILEAVVRSLEGGSSLSQAMGEHKRDLPPVMVYITAVAEVSGSLDDSYALLAKQFEQEDHFGRKVKSALAYPSVVMFVAMVVVVFMLTFVLPTYAGMFSQMGAKLPASTKFMLDLGDFLKNRWYLALAGMILVVLVVRQALRLPGVRAALQRLTLKLPLWGQLTYRRELTNLCRTLGTMLKSGVPLLAALRTVQDAVAFMPFREALSDVQERVQEGEMFGQALHRQPVFDKISVEIVSLGEEVGSMDAMLFRIAELSEKDVNTMLERLTSMLEPALTVLLGGIIVSIIVPMLLPMFDILGQIK